MAGSKFIYAVMTVFMVELAVWLFGGSTYGNTSLFAILLDPSTLLNSNLYVTVIVAALIAFAASAIIPGQLWSINIYALYAGVVLVFMGFLASVIHLWVLLHGSLTTLGYPLSSIIPTLITFPVLIFYLIAGLEWVRSNQ